MTRFDPTHSSLSNLKDKVVVLTGGASGIGAATVKLLHDAGAKVIFGDLNETDAQSVIQSTSSSSIHFLKTDVCVYQDNVALFKLALEKYGRVDHAIANAGLVEQGGWFDPRAGIKGVEKEPTSIVIDVNLKGVMYFSNIACTYLAHENDPKSPADKSLTLLSSVAGWKESPGLFVYQASKHGVLGLMRALRLYAPKAFPGVRVNTVNPSMTLTRMVAGIKDDWVSAGLPVNEPVDVARVLVGLCVSGPGTKAISYDVKDSEASTFKSAGGSDWRKEGAGVNGRAIYVSGGKCWDIEEGLDRTEHLWLGTEPSEMLIKGQSGLGDGMQWVQDDKQL